MNPAHKSMKMNPHFSIKWQALIKIVHQIGFAAAHTTPEVEPPLWLQLLFVSAEQRQKPFWNAIACNSYQQTLVERLQVLNGLLLRRVMIKTLFLFFSLISLYGGQLFLRHGKFNNRFSDK